MKKVSNRIEFEIAPCKKITYLDAFSAVIRSRVFDCRYSENRRNKGKLLLVRFVRRGVKKGVEWDRGRCTRLAKLKL